MKQECGQKKLIVLDNGKPKTGYSASAHAMGEGPGLAMRRCYQRRGGVRLLGQE